MSAVGIAAGSGVALVAWLVVEVQRWWTRCRVAARGSLPRPRPQAPAVVADAVADAGLDVDPVFALRLWVGGAAGGVALALTGPTGRVVGVLAIVGPPVGLLLARGRAARRRAAQLPVALDAVAAAMRAGAALRTAVGEAASVGPPLGPELADLARRSEHGVPLAVAIDDWARRNQDGTADLAAAALAVAADVGGPGADAVEAAAASIRDQAATAAEATSLSVQARLSAVVLSAAPIAFTLLLSGVDPASSHFLLATPAGWSCLVLGLGLDLLGALWMRRLVRGTR